MKTRILTALILLSVIGTGFLTGCKKDKGSDPGSIVGTWTIKNYDYVDFENGVKDEYSEAEAPGNYVKFNANNTLEVFTDDLYTGGWSIDNNRLILTGNDLDAPDDGFIIKKHTSNELDLYVKEVYGDDYYEMTMHLTR